MRKKLLFFTGIVLLCLAGRGLFLYNKPHGGVGDTKADVAVTSADLYHQYNADETTANAKFMDKIITVTGVVSEVSQADKTCTILLKNKEDGGGVSCNLFNHPNALVKEGETVTIKGRCTGFLMDVALTGCEIEKQ